MKLGFIGLLLSLTFINSCTTIQSNHLGNLHQNDLQQISKKDIGRQEPDKKQEIKSKFSDVLKGLESKDGDSGLLLGFATDTSQNRKGYAQFYDFDKPDLQKIDTNRTVYLTRKGKQVKLAVKLNYIASPQAQGFIYAGQVRHLEKPRIKYCGCIKCNYSKCLIGFDYSRIWVADSKQQIAAARDGIIQQIKETINSEFDRRGVDSQDVTDYETISFISDGFYVAEGFWSKITGGAAWFTAHTKNFVVPLSSTKKISSNLRDLYGAEKIEKAFGRRTMLRWGGQKVDVVDASTFTLTRVSGRTHVLGLIEVDGNAHRSFHNPFDLGNAPKTLVKYDNPSLDFKKFKSIYPTLIDIYVSPNQNTIFVLTKEEIVGIDVPTEKEIFKLKHNLLFNKVVMVEWSTGNFVTEWEKELAE